MARPKKNKGAAKAASTAKVETPVINEEANAAPAAEEVKAETAAPVAEEKKAEPKKAAAKSTAKRTSKTAAAAKSTAKTAAKTTEKTTAKAAAKKTTVEKRVVLQYAGNQISGAELVERAKSVSGISDAKKIEVYVKPEENKAYYVIDDNNAGDFDLF